MDAVELMEPPNKINVAHERGVIIGSVAKVLFQEYGLRHRQTCPQAMALTVAHTSLACDGLGGLGRPSPSLLSGQRSAQ